MKYQAFLAILISMLLAACSSHTSAPVSDRSLALGVSSSDKPADYIVKKGDTLYSIAFRYGLDYKQLASGNGIGRNYQIYPGQKIRLKPVVRVADSARIRDKSQTAQPNLASQPSAKKSVTPAPKAKVAHKPAEEVTTKVTKPTAQAAVKTPVAKPTATVSKPKTEPVRSTEHKKLTGPIRWQWPAQGKVSQYFKTKGTVNKGINIAGRKGAKVVAAAAGRVVYAGNGLLGYGNLVIIDHNQQFLSAYAHNSRVLVKESDMVKAGQKIAEMGSTGTDRVMLHFEIRRDGKPMNPLRYLPKK